MEWPYIAPRVEFVLSGFANEKHVFAFEQVSMNYSTGGEVTGGHAAQCIKCGTQLVPERENLREHGRLHLAVELAKR